MKTVQDIMWKNVVAASPEVSVADAAKRMVEEDVGCLVVIDEGRIRGIVTDRDLLKCAAHNHKINECTISKHMSSPVITVPQEIPLINLARVMASSRIKRVPITNGSELVGIVSFSDIADDMDRQVADMWAEWLQLIAVTKTSSQHRRGRRANKENQGQVKGSKELPAFKSSPLLFEEMEFGGRPIG